MLSRFLLAFAFACATASFAAAQGVKRVVIMKIDGLPGYYADQFVRQRDPATGRSVLPWMEEVFYKNGTRVPNFYTRGPSLSGPAWGMLDTGQHMQIKGNVEYDRYTMYAYDYLNFFNYQLKFSLKQRQDMPAVEVLDQLGIPIMSDIFPFNNRYLSAQLYQRGNDWNVLASGFVKLYPGNPSDFIDEWTIGLDWRHVIIGQAERDIIGKLTKRPDIDYFDYYNSSFDHVSHHNNDTASRLIALKDLDRTIGRIWMAIQSSPRAAETALVLVSDHGVNSEDKVYSQGFNIVKILGSLAGGGHHVVTKRRLMLEYSVKGGYPLVPLIKTASEHSLYLDGQATDYSTALVDFDGNERSSVHLRNSDLNILHILLQQVKRGKLSAEAKAAATDAFFEIVDRNRGKWKREVEQISDELDALHRWIEAEQTVAAGRPKKLTPEQISRGIDNEHLRADSLVEIAIRAERSYRDYLSTLKNLLGLTPDSLPRAEIKNVIASGAMGDGNSIHHLQNYVVGPSIGGLVVGADKRLDLEKSFSRVNYFELFHGQKVRNNVQATVGHKPVDFVAVRVPARAISDSLPEDLVTGEDAVWLFGGSEKQILILSQTGRDGAASYYYLPVKNLRQDSSGRINYDATDIGEGFPLRYFEDAKPTLSGETRARWFGAWHSEIDWLNAVHKGVYSNAIIGLKEQFSRNTIFEPDDGAITSDERLIRRFRRRQREMTEPDLLILSNNHWNFDVRGFNPGGNHGSFFRVSTNSTFMIAGGERTGIPRANVVEQPYDSLSFVPTVLRLMGKVDDDNRPSAELRQKGFRRFPGRVIKEITGGD